MTPIIIIFGALTALAGLVILINPDIIFGWLRTNFDKPVMQILAVVVRLIIGILLVLKADGSRLPVTMQIIGWMSIAAAVFFAVIGRQNFNRIMKWALSLQKKIGRVAGVFAIGFGAFLVWAFV